MKSTYRDYSKMDSIMKSLNCEGETGIYTSEDLNMEFDLTATADDKILLTIGCIMADRGHECSNEEFRTFIGV